MRPVIIVLAILFATGLGQAAPQNVSRDLDTNRRVGDVDVIVQFKEPPTERHRQKMSQRGGTLKADLGVIRGMHYRIPARALADLAGDPDIAYITPDRPVAATPDYATLAP